MNCRLSSKFGPGVFLTLFSLVFSFYPDLSAHPIVQSYWFIRVDSTHIESQILIPLEEIASIPEVRTELEGPPRRELGELRSLLEAIVLRSFVLSGPVLTGERRIVEFEILPSDFLQVKLRQGLESGPRTLTFRVTFHEKTVHAHQTFCRIQSEPSLEFTLDFQNPVKSVAFPLTGTGSGSGWLSFVSGFGFLFLRIVPALLFLCLLLKSPTARSLAYLLSLFLLGEVAGFLFHSAFGTEFQTSFVQTALALSLGYVALENLLLRADRPRTFSPAVLGLVLGALLGQIQRFMSPGQQVTVGLGALFLVGVLAAQLLVSASIMLLYLKSWFPLGDRVQRVFWWACLGCGLLFFLFALLKSPFGL